MRTSHSLIHSHARALFHLGLFTFTCIRIYVYMYICMYVCMYVCIIHFPSPLPFSNLASFSLHLSQPVSVSTKYDTACIGINMENRTLRSETGSKGPSNVTYLPDGGAQRGGGCDREVSGRGEMTFFIFYYPVCIHIITTPPPPSDINWEMRAQKLSASEHVPHDRTEHPAHGPGALVRH